MQTYENAPPPYPGTAINIVTSKGEYRNVPIYEISPPNAPIYNQPSFTPITSVLPRPNLNETYAVPVGHNSVHCVCPYCLHHVVTRVDHESGSFAWLMCLLLTVVGCVPCCVIPFFSTSCQDIIHTCPNCSAVIGRRKIL